MVGVLFANFEYGYRDVDVTIGAGVYVEVDYAGFPGV